MENVPLLCTRKKRGKVNEDRNKIEILLSARLGCNTLRCAGGAKSCIEDTLNRTFFSSELVAKAVEREIGSGHTTIPTAWIIYVFDAIPRTVLGAEK